MATHHQYYQPATAFHSNMPSKAPVASQYFPIGRVPVSPPDLAESYTTTTAASRASDSASGTGDYDTSSLSGVDVVDMLHERVSNAFDPTPLDRGLAMQAQA
jgi:biogenesis of lysosome-related organelles complex 1 subunit KXD1